MSFDHQLPILDEWHAHAEPFTHWYHVPQNLWEGKTDAQFNGEIDDFQEGMRAFLQKTIDTTRNETVNTQEDNVRLQGLLDALKNSTLEGCECHAHGSCAMCTGSPCCEYRS